MKKEIFSKSGSIIGIKIHTINYIMIIAAVIIYSLVLWKTISIQRYYNEFMTMTQGYIESRNDAISLRMGSDYLTSQSRLFSVTQDKQYFDNYFNEVDVSRRRDKAVEGIKKHIDNEQLIGQLDAAFKMSNDLMNKEIYSMRLVIEGMHYDISTYNKAVQECSLSAEDAALSDAQKLARAENMLLNEDYLFEKGRIDTKINNSIETIVNYIHSSQIKSAERLRSTFFFQTFIISMLFIMSILIFMVVIILVIKPLNIYMECIKNGQPLKMSSAYEFNYLAHTYNNIYKINEANKNLQYTAEHDGLTGLLNRGAFNDFTAFIENKESSIALLMIDVDNFKMINDTHGHDTGDRILKKLADTLSSCFRTSDCVARLGGDEFAVIMMNVTEKIQSHICEIANNINQSMADTSDDLPKASVSIGIAFSQNGYSNELYRASDSALYKAKSDGKNRYRFYSG